MNLDAFYFGPLPGKLARAEELYARWGDRLLAEPRVASRLAELDLLSAALREQMAAMGMFALCTACGAKPGGGCCSAEMANQTDSILFLANLLLGVKAAVQHHGGVECCFLGPQGCSLRLKPIFCLNYNCRTILAGDPGALLLLERATGRLLTAQTHLEDLLLAYLKGAGE